MVEPMGLRWSLKLMRRTERLGHTINRLSSKPIISDELKFVKSPII